jgi:hypothetical protein
MTEEEEREEGQRLWEANLAPYEDDDDEGPAFYYDYLTRNEVKEKPKPEKSRNDSGKPPRFQEKKQVAEETQIQDEELKS